MNNENVFFNPGDAIASSHDFKEARRSAEIIKSNKPTGSHLIIAKNTKNGEYAIYLANKKLPSNTKEAQEFKITDRL